MVRGATESPGSQLGLRGDITQAERGRAVPEDVKGTIRRMDRRVIQARAPTERAASTLRRHRIHGDVRARSLPISGGPGDSDGKKRDCGGKDYDGGAERKKLVHGMISSACLMAASTDGAMSMKTAMPGSSPSGNRSITTRFAVPYG